MNSVIVLDQLVEETNNRIKLFRKHLSDHEAGENVLTRVIEASTETSLEIATNKVRKYKEMLDVLEKNDAYTEKEKHKILEAVYRKKIHDNFEIKSHSDTNQPHIEIKPHDKKLQVMMVIDEVSNDLEIEDRELFNIASKSLFLDEEERFTLEEKLEYISKTFNDKLKKLDKTAIKQLSSLNYKIPVFILHFSILLDGIKASYEKKEKEFSGFPRYQDWWVYELWSSHQAYYGLYKLKEMISRQCVTVEQQNSWAKIFENWLSIKIYLNNKGKLAYPYMEIFDKLVATFCGFEEETMEQNLVTMEALINDKIKNENFTRVQVNHSVLTSYLEYKKKVLEEKAKREEKEKEKS